MKFFVYISFLFLSLFNFSCGTKMPELDCGCQKSSESQDLVYVSGRDIRDTLAIFEALTTRDNTQYRYNVYGVCLEGNQQHVVFCARSSGDYRDLRDQFPEARVRDIEFR